MISDLSGIAAHLDDIIVVGQSENELQDCIKQLLSSIQEYEFDLCAQKCQFFLRSIKYIGFIFESNGRRPDPESVHAISDMPAHFWVWSVITVHFCLLCMRSELC